MPPNRTATYQPLDQGLISQAKIWYRSMLLRQLCNNEEKKRAGEHGFKNNSGRGSWRLREGQLPHIADAINIIDEFWSQTGQISIPKCWIKSKYPPNILQERAVQLLIFISKPLPDLTSTNSVEHTVDLELNYAVPFTLSGSLERDIAMMTYLHNSTSTESSFVKSAMNSCLSSSFHSILNSPDSVDVYRLQGGTPEVETRKIYENFKKTTRMSRMEERIQENTTTVMNPTAEKLNESIENVSAVTFDDNLRSALLNAIAVTKNVGNLA